MRVSAPGILTAVFVAFLPFASYQGLYSGGVNAKYFLVVLFAGLLALIAARYFYTGKTATPIRRRWMLFSIVLALLVYYAAAFAGVFPERSLWSDVLRSTGTFFLTHVAFIVVLLGEMLTVRDWSMVRRTVAISGGFFALLSFLGGEGFGVMKHFLWVNLEIHGLSFANSTFAGAYLVLAFVFGLGELVRSKKGWRGNKALGISLLLIVLSPTLLGFGTFSDPAGFLGSARASSATVWLFLAFLGGFLLLRRFVPKGFRKYAIGGWSAAVLGAVLVGITLLFTPGSFVQEKYIETSTAARLIVWEGAAKAIKERPLLGWGQENFDQAYQKHFDSRSYLPENLGEIWFDRAHNIIIDTLIEVGALGFAAWLFVVACFELALLRARRKGLIEATESAILAALPVAHFLQLQTSFDTVATYALLGIIGGYALWLERETVLEQNVKGNPIVQKALAVGLVVLALLSFKFVLLDEYQRQSHLLATLTTANAAEQEAHVRRSLERTSSYSSLRFSANSFTSGAFEYVATRKEKADKGLIRSRLSLYETYYERYLEEQPAYYRARMNYAYLLLLSTAFGENRTDDAKKVIRESYALSPGNPLTYVLDALAELYSGNMDEADRLMSEALAMSPESTFLQETAKYFERQRTRFPALTVLQLSNL